MLIRDVIKPDHQGEFVGDVQLGWYPHDQRNLEFAERYIFTATAPDGMKSSTDLLEAIRNALVHGRENRLVVIATYGHGKTHFALALANVFGRPAETPEAEAIFGRLERAIGPSRAAGF